MSAISTILARLRSAIWAIDVRDDIADAIEQCYSDVSNPTLQTDALEAAIQEKIDEGEMAALTIGDGTITASKLAANAVTTPKIADGSITQAKLDPNIDFVQVDDTLSQTGEAADAAAVGAAIDELNGSLENLTNLSDVVDSIVPEQSIYSFDSSEMTSGLINTSNGTIGSAGATGAVVSDYVAVTGGTTYIIKNVNRAGYYDTNKIFISMISTSSNGNPWTPTYDGYVRLNVTPANIDIAIAKIKRLSTAIDTVARKTCSYFNNSISAKVTGDLSSGETLKLSSTNNVKKNNLIVFSAYITNFSSLMIGHGTTNIYDSYIGLNSTSIIIHNRTNSDNAVTYEHGLTISGYIRITIRVKNDSTADITLLSGGGAYTISNALWYGFGKGDIYVSSVNSTMTNCVLEWVCADLQKSVWVFGDSYITHTDNERWTYYLAQDGFLDGILLNGYGGQNSTDAVATLNAMIIAYGTPKYIVWLHGMNDGSDADASTPKASWKTAIDTLLAICDTYGITPVLATIPTVPSVSNEGKNAFVRASGKRYIDMAVAVGATPSGVWYSGMIESDNVHPTASGAMALYNRVLIDFPEIAS